MHYIYATQQLNYEDYASGRVLYNMPGTAPFPARLGSEIFERCKAALASSGVNGPYTLYDPFCGGGYLLTVLGFLHGRDIKRIVASDIDNQMVCLAMRNLNLLNAQGIKQRIEQIEKLLKEYKKESHKNALDSAIRLTRTVESRKGDMELDCFCANALNLGEQAGRLDSVDVVITDIPYGRITNWSDESSGSNHAELFLESLYHAIPSHSIVAVVSDKKQKVKSGLYKRMDYFSHGKRKVTIFKFQTVN